MELGDIYEIRVSGSFESARHLPKLPSEHPCSRVHGHSFMVELVMRGKLQEPVGWVQDYHEIRQALNALLKELDHKLLNEIPGLENPTTELICRYLMTKLKPKLPNLVQIIIKETKDSECRYPIL